MTNAQLTAAKIELYQLAVKHHAKLAQNANNAYERDYNWNKSEAMETVVYNLKTYGQESAPTKIYDEEGYEIGYTLENGETIHNAGLDFATR